MFKQVFYHPFPVDTCKIHVLLISFQASKVIPDLSVIKAVQKITWSSSSCSLHLVHASNDDIHKAHEKV